MARFRSRIGSTVAALALLLVLMTAACGDGATPQKPDQVAPSPTVSHIPTSSAADASTAVTAPTPPPTADAPTSTPAPPTATPSTTLTPATVTRVVDGDTLVVAFDGREERLRIIGVDTPETVHPSEPVQCFGPEASAQTQALIDQVGGEVLLEKDVSETDRYGRLLRYVWLDDQRMLNEELVTGGYAQVSTFPPDVKYHDRFLAAQREAREAGRGLWGACGGFGVPEAAPTPTPVPQAPDPPVGGDINHAGVPPVSEYDCPADYPVKGNANSGIYHTKSSRSYNQTKPEICFHSAADAETAGFRAPRR